MAEVTVSQFADVLKVPVDKLLTQHDEADITALEAFRASRSSVAEAEGVKLSPLVFVMKAVVVGLRQVIVRRPSAQRSARPRQPRSTRCGPSGSSPRNTQINPYFSVTG